MMASSERRSGEEAGQHRRSSLMPTETAEPKCRQHGLRRRPSSTSSRKRTIARDLVTCLRSWIGFLFNQHINFGAQMSPITLKLLLTSMTVVTVASKEEGKWCMFVLIVVVIYQEPYNISKCLAFVLDGAF